MLRNHHIDKAIQCPQLVVHVLSGSAKPETRNQQNVSSIGSGSGAAVMTIRRPAKPASEGFSIYIVRLSPTGKCPSGR
jgi:hypothetical protein